MCFTGPCAHGQFKCANGYDSWNDNAVAENDVCIDGQFTCDDTQDCSDGSDEDEHFCRGVYLCVSLTTNGILICQ